MVGIGPQDRQDSPTERTVAMRLRHIMNLTDEQIDRVALEVVYENDETIPHREGWCMDIGRPFARAILAAAAPPAPESGEPVASEVQRLRDALELMWDRYENGDPCHDDTDDECGGNFIGNAVRLFEDEEREILALIPKMPTKPSRAFPVPAPPVQRDAEPVAWPTERIAEYIEEYELCADEGYYSPSEHERLLIADAIHGLLADDEILADIRACAAPLAQRDAERADCSFSNECDVAQEGKTE
jgi:hypothetical protein